MRYILKLVDIFLHLIHLGIIFFFLFALFVPELRFAHFILSILILLSWAGLGFFFGFGYCLITDLHWKVKRQLNQEPATEYYIKHMIDKITGLDTSPELINSMTTYIYFSILIASTLLIIFKGLNL